VIARRVPMVGVLILVLCGMLLASGRAAWAEDGKATLTLDPAFAGPFGRTLEEQPATLRDCAAVPGGMQVGMDGWRFDQPVAGAPVSGYAIGFIKEVDGQLGTVVILISAAGLFEVTATAGAARFDASAVGPPPAGVTGGLVDAGAGGAWLGTPHGWRLAGGALEILASAGERTTFGLSAVCLPGSASPSPSPSSSLPSSSPAPTISDPAAAPSTSAVATTPAAASLPVTGGRMPLLVVGGSALLVLGGALLAVRRQRDRVRFTG
jgi:LPXTG-motif cell wall-anchored protein